MGAYGSYLFGMNCQPSTEFNRSLTLGTFTYTPGDDINDRPIYRQSGGNAYFAVKTTTYPSLPNWIGSNTANTQPGDGSGFIFEQDYLNPKCPHAVSNWKVFYNGETALDPTFKFECAVGKNS